MIRLKELRNKLKLSQREVANKVGVNVTMYSRYENGLNEPDFKTLIKIADFFNVSIDTVLGRKSDMIDKRKLSDEQNEMINLVCKFTPKQLTNALGYLRRLDEEK